LLSARTGLHPEDQKLVYKDKERGSKAFLDMAGVKDRSKMMLLEDPAAQAKRLLEQRRTDKADPAGDGVPRRIRSVAARGGRIRRARTVRRGGLPPPRPRRRDLHHGPETLGPDRLLLFSLPERHGSAAVGSPDPSPVGSPVGSRTGSPAGSWFFLFFLND